MKITDAYTDGSVFNNRRRESLNTFGGVGVFFYDNDDRNISEPFFEFPITNQRTEIKAASKAIISFMQDKIKKKNTNKEILIINTDSQYLINIMQKWILKWKLNQWKTIQGTDVLNKDLIFELDHLVNLYKDFLIVKFNFVKAHTQPPKNKSSINFKHWYGNKKADQLARRGTMISMKSSKI